MIMTEERREQLQNMLQVVETAIIELVSNKVASYKIGERFFTYHTIDDLLKLKKDIQNELNSTPITIVVDPFED